MAERNRNRDERYLRYEDRDRGARDDRDREEYAGERGSGFLGGDYGRGDVGFRDFERGYGIERGSDTRDVRMPRRSYRGRGPKGFQRSDERLRELISERLEDHDAIDASDIEVLVSNGEVTLSGTVDDRRTKRLAEDVVEDIGGVRDVHNNLKIDREFFSRRRE